MEQLFLNFLKIIQMSQDSFTNAEMSFTDSFAEDLDGEENYVLSPVGILALVTLGLLVYEQSEEDDSKTKNYGERLGYIPRCALVDPNISPWVKLYASNSERSMITFTGLDYGSFHFLAIRFEELYNKYTPYSRDGRILIKPIRRYFRPRSLDGRGCLALVLAYGRSRGNINILCMLFGIINTIGSLWIRYGRRLLLKILVTLPGSKVQMPSMGDIRIFQDIIAEKYPTLQGCWFVMDGLKIPIEAAKKYSTQILFYNGWQHAHFITNLYVFSPDGCIVACSINNPGTIHDSQIADFGGVYEKLETQYNICGGKGVGDSAFSGRRCPFIIKTSQILSNNATEFQRQQQIEATSVRQSAEWGNRGFKSSFPRLYDTIHYEEYGERLIFLLSLVYLYNFRARYVGYNQIQTVFIPHLEQYNANNVMQWYQNIN